MPAHFEQKTIKIAKIMRKNYYLTIVQIAAAGEKQNNTLVANLILETPIIILLCVFLSSFLKVIEFIFHCLGSLEASSEQSSRSFQLH